MVFYEVFSHPELRRYKASIFSKATIIQIFSIIVTFLCPFLIAYFSGGFWIKEKYSLERSTVNFQYRYLAFFETDTNFYLSSSYENVNQIYADAYIPAVRTIYETDDDNDGKFDQLQMDILVSGIPSNQIVKSVKLLLMFNNIVDKHAKVKFESIGYIEASNSKISNDLSISGELEMFQYTKFIDRVTYDEYNYQYLNDTNLALEGLEIAKILSEYFDRPYGTRLKTDYVYWTNKNSDGFNINAKIRYPSYRIIYVPAFWQQIKNGWIQYIAVLIPFIYIFRLVKIFVFENQLIPVIAIMSNNKVKTT